MRYFRPRPGLTAWLLLLSTVAFIAGGSALAQVPVTDYVVINPIDVCDSSGKNCAPFSVTCKASTGCTAINNPSTATTSTTSIATQPTPIGFIDGDTGINNTRAIWLQSGIDVTFLKLQQYNSPTLPNGSTNANIDPWCATTCAIFPFYSATDYRTLHTGNVTCNDGVSKLTSPDFQVLTQHSICSQDMGGPVAATLNPPPKLSPAPPLASTLGTGMSNAIDMFFVNSIQPSPPSVYGFSWINGNGIAIAKSAFGVFGLSETTITSPPRFDTISHEIGHALGLDHATFGAGTANNVMTGGSSNPNRTVPLSSGCSSTNGGALYELDKPTIDNCPVLPATPIADQLILGNSTNVQQGQVLLSGFMVPIPQGVTATAVGDVNITVNYPKFQQSGGRSAEQYVVALVIGLPSGDNFGNPEFANPNPPGFLFGFQTVNGNNGNGNLNCVKPFSGGPSIKCGVVLFQPNQFTSGTSFSFTANIVSNGAVLTQIPAGTTMTFVFNDGYATTSAFEHRDKTTNQEAVSGFPVAAVPSAIVDLTDCSTFPNVCSLGLVFTGVLNPLTGQPTPCTTKSICPSGNLPQGAD